jgi:phosphoglycerate dehydrogenase-like enzyme
MTLFSDLALSGIAQSLLREGVRPHTLIEARRPTASVLAKAELDPAFLDAEVAFGQPDLDAIRASTRLRWIHLTSAGYTRYDTPAFRDLARERSLVVTNSSHVYAQPCAEHVFAFLMAQSRCLPAQLASSTPNGSAEWLHLRAIPRSPRGQHVLILGFGTIARYLLPMLAPFDMRVTALRRNPRGNEGVPTVTPDQLAALLPEVDHVINILPDNADSRGFIDAAFLAALRPGAVYYNIGRGTTTDQAALDQALRSGHLAAAWLDVTDPEPLPTEHPLRSAPNCFITPHTAGGHHGEAEALVGHFLANLERYAAGQSLLDVVIGR